MTDDIDLYRADQYDAVLPLLVPAWSKARDIYVAASAAALAKSRLGSRTYLSVADLGCGSGINFIDVLKTVPDARAVAIDTGESMLAGYRQNLASAGVDADRVRMVQHDASSGDMFEQPDFADLEQRCDVCCASFFANNLDEPKRRHAYENVRRLLKPNGSFLIWDIYGFDDPNMQSLALAQEMRFIEQSFDKAIANAAASAAINLKNLRDRWLRHYTSENYYPSISSGGEISEVPLIQAAGFGRFEVLFRFGMQAILLFSK